MLWTYDLKMFGLLTLNANSAGSSLSRGRDWGGPAVPHHFSADSWGCEYKEDKKLWVGTEYAAGVGTNQ